MDTFTTCPCDQLILTQVWVHAQAAVLDKRTVVQPAVPGHWAPLPVPLTPMGVAHPWPHEEERRDV